MRKNYNNQYGNILFVLGHIFVVLAIVDLSVGVSNDAVNFLNSAIGARAASFKVIIAIAAVGVFVGAALSNGMMDIARHGIYQPQHFISRRSCVSLRPLCLRIGVTGYFNSLGMPTRQRFPWCLSWGWNGSDCLGKDR